MDCCDTQKSHNSTPACPACDTPGRKVQVRTLKHWLKTPLVFNIPDLSFYLCQCRDCTVVYFSGEGSVQYAKDDLRYTVGIKEISCSVPVCYCFGVTGEMILKEIQDTGKSAFSARIAGEVKLGNCACDVRNPSGRCCLGEIKEVEAEGLR